MRVEMPQDTASLQREVDRVASQGEKLYRETIPASDKITHRGQYVAIDPSTMKFAFGQSVLLARSALRVGEDTLVYLRRVGEISRMCCGRRRCSPSLGA